MAVSTRAAMDLCMNLDEYAAKASKLILETLKLVQRVSVDPRIFGKVPMKVLIGNDGGMAPQVTVEFLGAYWAKKTVGATFDLFLDGEAEVMGHIDIYPIEDGTMQADLVEHINATTMKEVEDSFNKVMSIYAELDSKK